MAGLAGKRILLNPKVIHIVTLPIKKITYRYITNVKMYREAWKYNAAKTVA